MTRTVFAGIAATVLVAAATAFDVAAQAASGTLDKVPVAAWGAVGAIVAAWLGYLGLAKSKQADSLAEWREWAEDFRESEKDCRSELERLRAIAETDRQRIATLTAEVEHLTVQVARLTRQIHGEETL